jgi:membrane protease subunit (stomatin/prohibitin family)
MGLFSFIGKQFVDVVEWDNQPDGQLMWRFPFTDNEIQYGAQLTVRDGQIAVFVNEGQVADFTN